MRASASMSKRRDSKEVRGRENLRSNQVGVYCQPKASPSYVVEKRSHLRAPPDREVRYEKA